MSHMPTNIITSTIPCEIFIVMLVNSDLNSRGMCRSASGNWLAACWLMFYTGKTNVLVIDLHAVSKEKWLTKLSVDSGKQVKAFSVKVIYLFVTLYHELCFEWISCFKHLWKFYWECLFYSTYINLNSYFVFVKCL